MKRFMVTGFAANHVANQDSVNFTTNGGDVVVTGRNGVGKSTVKNSIMWALLGNATSGDKLVPYNSDESPVVEVELFDGTSYTQLRKELLRRKTNDGKSSSQVNCFISGIPVQLKDFNQFFSHYLTGELVEILLDLGSFFKQKTEVQRKVLTEHFSNVKDADVMANDSELAALETNGLTVEGHGKKMKVLHKQIKESRLGISPQIDLLTSQMIEVADEREELKEEVTALEGKLQKMNEEFAKWQEQLKNLQKPRDELSALNREIWQLENSAESIRDVMARNEKEVEKLREQWVNAAETCPTCGQAMNEERVQKVRDKIASKGTSLKIENEKRMEEVAAIEKRLESLKPKAEKLKSTVESQQFDSEELSRIESQRENVRREISARKSRIEKITLQLERNVENQRHIEELKVQEKDFGKQLIECERQLALAEKFTSKKMMLITDAINSNFQFVKFQMFEVQKNGEVKNTCVATLNGVPYELLSKGEKLKARWTYSKHFKIIIG